MSSDYVFDVLDPHAGESNSEPPGAPRRDFLRRLVVGGGVLSAGGALLAEFAPAASAAPSLKNDITILNAALILEDLGKTFYAEALKKVRLTGETKLFAETVLVHEIFHFDYIKKALGRDAKPLPTFDLSKKLTGQKAVQKNAAEIESICTAALVGVAPLLTRKTLAAAGPLLPVEAQHAAWISHIISADTDLPAPEPFNPKDTISGVEAIIAPLIAKK